MSQKHFVDKPYYCSKALQCLSASTSLPSNTNAPIWSMPIEIHGEFLLERLLLLSEMPSFDSHLYILHFAFCPIENLVNLKGPGSAL